MKKRFLNFYYHVLAYLARGYLKKHKPYIIGVNGSVGKTGCRMIINQTLEKFLGKAHVVYTSPENFNGELGMSLTIFRIEHIETSIFSFLKVLSVCMFRRYFSKSLYDITVLEYGIDRPGEMQFLIDIVKPDVGVFTKIDMVHCDQFGTESNLAKEESLMVRNTKVAVFLNSEDEYARKLYDKIYVDKFFYKTMGDNHGVKNQIDYSDVSIQKDDKLILKSTFLADMKGKKINISTNLVSNENFGYITLACTIVDIVSWKLSKKEFFVENQDIEIDYKLLPGRFSLFHGINDSLILDSSYNAAPMSMKSILNTAYDIQKKYFADYKLIFVLGDMRELGDYTKSEHENLAKLVAQHVDRVVFVGESTKLYTIPELKKLGKEKIVLGHYSKSTKAGEFLKSYIQKSDEKFFVVFKGSQNTIFLEEALKCVLDSKYKNLDKTLSRQDSIWIGRKNKFFAS